MIRWIHQQTWSWNPRYKNAKVTAIKNLVFSWKLWNGRNLLTNRKERFFWNVSPNFYAISFRSLVFTIPLQGGPLVTNGMATGVIPLLVGVITTVITGRGPPCISPSKKYNSLFHLSLSVFQNTRHFLRFLSPMDCVQVEGIKGTSQRKPWWFLHSKMFVFSEITKWDPFWGDQTSSKCCW